MSLDELSEVASKCREAGIQCALAGSLKLHHLDRLAKIGPDFIGVRGALCVDQKNRESAIDPDRTTEFVRAVREVRERGTEARAFSAH
jgi:(5-formylfuran-3-yl)methyl phosphate synthase